MYESINPEWVAAHSMAKEISDCPISSSAHSRHLISDATAIYIQIKLLFRIDATKIPHALTPTTDKIPHTLTPLTRFHTLYYPSACIITNAVNAHRDGSICTGLSRENNEGVSPLKTSRCRRDDLHA